jgi:type I restriction enzyme, S subunit
MGYPNKNQWVKTNLSDVFWFQEGPGVRNWQFTDTGIKLLNVANITKSGNIDLSKTDRCLSIEEVEEKYKHFLVDEGDLVIASSGISFDTDGLLRTRGAFIDTGHLPLCMNTSTIRFKSKEEVSHLSFLKFWLDSLEFRKQITRFVTGSAQQNFGPSHLKELQITLPPLEEQKRIAQIVGKCDRLRRTRRYTQQLSDTYLQSVFLEMFGDPVTNSMKWEISNLESQLERIESGWSPVCEEIPRSDTKQWAVLKLGAVKWGNFHPSENKLLPEKLIPRPELEVKKGNLLISRKNTFDLVAACTLVHETPSKLMLPDTIFRFILRKNSQLNSTYLWGLFNEKYFRKGCDLGLIW